MIKAYSVPRDFSWIENYKLNLAEAEKSAYWKTDLNEGFTQI